MATSNTIASELSGSSGLFGLTNREQKVISLLVYGKTNNEISKELGISIETVKKYIVSILKKMNVKNRIQIAVKAVRGRLVSFEEE